MRIIRDLISGNVTPVPFDVYYNGTADTDSVTKRYKGSLCKMSNWESTHGYYVTFAGVTTAMEGVCGILEEEQGITGNYLPDSTTYGCEYKKMTPLFPTSVIEAEYSRYDAAGTSNAVASGVTGTAGAAALAVTITTADYLIGGWVYFLTGSCAGFLTYILDNSTSAVTLDDVLPAAVLTTDDMLLILPPFAHYADFDATYSGLKSVWADNARTDRISGISTWIKAPGIPMTKLERGTHSGLIIENAQFYHQFVIPNNATFPNYWTAGILEA